ncbi:hypothetical protein JOE33_003674 [Pseudomonas sp. PvP027]|uniref:inovirus Gp2 family protein n=1 Tax=Pseudomonas sp. PvP027 TaxID=2806587 RepID=UPI001AEACAB4|nr:inovirus Gp2 family protein [Pseudomonas sp. PvP027]MBP1146751.1 hypothetical protein [Pseudomonas sp. PvP027]
MLRHPDNTNLILHNDSDFQGWIIQKDKGPFIKQYLHRLLETVRCALNEYSRVFAFRVDLRFPTGTQSPDVVYTNEVVGDFIESFRAKIEHNRNKARQRNKHAHPSRVRYVWAREAGQHGKPHYHLVILLNRDAFNALGYYVSGRNNIFSRLQHAWANALGVALEEAVGLVHIPVNARYELDRDKPEKQADFFYRASYLCKSATKVFGDGSHGFGASRI